METNINDTILNELEGIALKKTKKLFNNLVSPEHLDAILPEILNKLNKNQLVSIRKFLNIRNASGLNKEKLINIICSEYPNHTDLMLNILSLEEYLFIKRLAFNNNYIIVDKKNISIVIFLKDIGMVATGIYNDKNIVFIPIDLKSSIIKSINNTSIYRNLKQKKLVINTINGLVFYYGVITHDEAISMLLSINNINISKNDLISFIQRNDKFIVDNENELIYGFEVIDPSFIKAQHISREDLMFRPLTKKDIDTTKSRNIIKWTSYDNALYRFFTEKMFIDDIDATSMVKLCIYELKNGFSPSEVINDIKSNFNLTNEVIINHIIFLLNEMNNYDFKYILKGFSPKQVLHMENTNQLCLKIGRNVPCPCGSGKKYKNCCGK